MRRRGCSGAAPSRRSGGGRSGPSTAPRRTMHFCARRTNRSGATRRFGGRSALSPTRECSATTAIPTTPPSGSSTAAGSRAGTIRPAGTASRAAGSPSTSIAGWCSTTGRSGTSRRGWVSRTTARRGNGAPTTSPGASKSGSGTSGTNATTTGRLRTVAIFRASSRPRRSCRCSLALRLPNARRRWRATPSAWSPAGPRSHTTTRSTGRTCIGAAARGSTSPTSRSRG